MFVIVKQQSCCCRTFNANLPSISAVNNISKIPSFLKPNSYVQNLSWSTTVKCFNNSLLHRTSLT